MTDPSHRPPSVESLLSERSIGDLIGRIGRPVVTDLVRDELAHLRQTIPRGQPWPLADEIIAGIKRRAEGYNRQFPARVINATGVLIHTNLGRAPWSEELLCKIAPKLTSYISLEYDLDKGTRGKRGIGVQTALAALAQAEAALVVNNNAAAVYLTLSALAWNKEVIISRGELVQIGGGFRIPEILAKSGAVLREVGTTNKTELRDYEKACGPQTALIMKVHRSNFVQTGFVSEAQPKELAALGRKHGVPVIWDLGSGAVGPGSVCEYSSEPTLQAAVATGVDLVTSSGDKLLGGPQAGIILGKTELINKLRSDPYYRAVRPDKATLLALEATVAAHRAGRARELIPLYRMFAAPADELEQRARSLVASAQEHGWDAKAIQTADTPGGGSAPGQTIPGWGVRISGPLTPDEIARRARAFDPPIIGTVSDQAFILSVRTILPGQDDEIVRFFGLGPLNA
jgi:L-seryl-tRNA(Ser) seleniumtransferase